MSDTTVNLTVTKLLMWPAPATLLPDLAFTKTSRTGLHVKAHPILFKGHYLLTRGTWVITYTAI